MPNRPSRIEMVHQFFPELKEGPLTKSDREAVIRYNLLACEVVLSDLLQKFDREHEKHGPGVLCMRLHKGARKSEYLTEKEVQSDYDLAVQDGAKELQTQLKGVVDAIQNSNINQCGLVMRVDNSGLSVIRIPRDNPASALEAMMQELSA
ncbi:MAG: hypothetical protein CBD74_01870 [Saprospirales bacterium TMED214]|nr:MAG: hypothetical protein CBD74_01870 [Saprospirales bacterium TMED214]